MSSINTEISIQTMPALAAWALKNSFRAWCEHCLDVVPALDHESVIRLLRLSSKGLAESLESGRLHFTEVGLPSSPICVNHVEAILRRTITRNEGPKP
jgi:hypothetical protein